MITANNLRQRASGALHYGLTLLRSLALGASVLIANNAFAGAETSSDFAAFPPSNSDSAAPLVMLLLSHDHQLYIKAYNDYSDLNEDGVIDTTYNDTIEYAGYFDSDYCYGYDTDRFQPRKAAIGTNGHTCIDVSATPAGAPWSGNFLNWATMSRMDVVRRTLYGGKRYTDPAEPADGPVILERALLPQDLHSFAKVYEGGDLSNFTPYTAASHSAVTLCNITPRPGTTTKTLTKDIDTSAYPPKIRIASGGWRDWSATENTQCTWRGAEGNLARPEQSADELETLNARVEVCVDGLDGSTSSQCRKYTNDNIKPIGLLQEFGETKGMRFGLLTGSYTGTRRGGLLRKNIGYLVDNTDDPTQDEVDLDSGVFLNQGLNDTGATYPGIINTLNRLRISQYDYDNEVYDDCSSNGIGSSTFNNDGSDSSVVSCRDWGNPISELYAEALRYFSGKNEPFDEFAGDDSEHINNLKPVEWTDPQPASDDCAQCAIIVLSTGLGNFDGMVAARPDKENELPGDITNLSYAALSAKMQKIGTIEGINGSYFIGSTGVENPNGSVYGRCTAKTLTPANFVDARGLCPEMPNMRGSYQIAGLAYHAKNQDMRPLRDGKQSVGTWAVQLAEMLPTFEVNVGSNKVKFIPYCRATGSGTERQCSLVNVEVIDHWQDGTGELHISWEDSSFGSDYDLDGKQQLKVCVGAACDDPDTPEDESVYSYQVKFTVDAINFKPDSNALDMEFGYIIAGTYDDGPYLDIQLDNKVKPTAVDQAPDPVSRSFTPGLSGTSFLENPLWYAAKYGSFNDIDGDGTPLHNGDPANKAEWDIKDTNGNVVAGGDGLPDSYYYVRNPSRLATRMRAIFQSLTSAVQSHTSAAVISTTGRGVGALYQAVYYPKFERKDALGNVVDSILWAGALNALFIDDRGRLREDNGVKHKLESSSIDYPINIYFDEDRQQTLVQRYDDNDISVGAPYPLRAMEPIWSAGEKLSELAEVVTQRTYSDDAGTGRHILTWIDRNGDRVVDNDLVNANRHEVIAFAETNFPKPDFDISLLPILTGKNSANYKWLGLSNSEAELAKYLVNYIRGKEYADGEITVNDTDYPVRSRTIDADGDGTDEVWRLGDIIHSSPVVVAAPSNSEYTSSDYLTFQAHYQNRRQVVYIGANDGMLHAFNGGFFDSATQSFVGGGDLDGDSFSDVDFHTIGAELWAYVPGNLLPHLRWLTEPDYPHVYYVDGAVQSFDAKIFASDADHPGGWGTILVVGLRLGGGEISLDVKTDTTGSGNPASNATIETKSAYVVLDVTNPEKAPKVIAELGPGDLGFSISNPVLVRRTTGGANDWLLVFGNGPDSLSTVTSSKDSQIFVYDLVHSRRGLIDVSTLNTDLRDNVKETNSYFGNFTRVDWKTITDDDGIDGSDDAIFVGTVGGSSASPTGVLKKIVLDTAEPNLGLGSTATAFTALAVGQPISSAPITTRDTRKKLDVEEWVSFGTGRYEVSADTNSNAEQAYYGILNPTSAAAGVDLLDPDEGIVDLTEVVVLPDSIDNVQNRDGSAVQYTRDSTTTTFIRYKALARFVNEQGGWYRRFQTGYTGHGAERNVTDPTHFGSTLLFTTYMPTSDSCTVGGLGFLYGLNAFSGLPPEPRGSLGTGINNGSTHALERVGLGNTVPSKPVVHSSAVGGSKAIVQGSRGEFLINDLFGAPLLAGRQSWREVQGIEFLLTD